MTGRQSLRNAMLWVVPAFMLVGLAGCKCGESSSSSSGQEIPADLTILFGRQGTFAGRSMGYSINADGDVVRWEGKFPGENQLAAATVGRHEVRRLWRRAEEIGFLQMKEQAMATEGLFITLSAGGESRRVTWVARAGEAKTPVQAFFDECMDVAKTALGEKSDGESG